MAPSNGVTNYSDDDERSLFANLAVFRGGAELDAAEAILIAEDDAGADVTDVIMSLVDKSLLNVRDGPDGEPRISMLQSIGSYAAERLDGEPRVTALRERHARHYMAFAEEIESGLDGERPQDALARLDDDHDNLRAALDWSMDHDPGVGLRIGAAIWRFWQQRAHLAEGRWRLEALLEHPNVADDPCASAGAATALGGMAYRQNALDKARAGSTAGLAAGPSPPQQACRVPMQLVAVLSVNRLVDRLVAHPHVGPVGEQPWQRHADLLRAPAFLEMQLDELAQFALVSQLPGFRSRSSMCGSLLCPERLVCPGLGVAVASNLSAHRGGSATELLGDVPDALLADQPVGDRDSLSVGQESRRHRMLWPGDRRIHPGPTRAIGDGAAAPPAGAGPAVDPHDPADRGVVHTLSHELKISVTLTRQWRDPG